MDRPTATSANNQSRVLPHSWSSRPPVACSRARARTWRISRSPSGLFAGSRGPTARLHRLSTYRLHRRPAPRRIMSGAGRRVLAGGWAFPPATASLESAGGPAFSYERKQSIAARVPSLVSSRIMNMNVEIGTLWICRRRLRRFPPERASALPPGQAMENAKRFPPLAHRSAAAHKLHSVPISTLIFIIREDTRADCRR